MMTEPHESEMMRKISFPLVLALMVITSTAHSEDVGKKVSMQIPDSWELRRSEKANDVQARLYRIKKDTIESAEYYTEAFILYYAVPSSMSISQADNIVKSHARGSVLLVSAQDSPYWKTYLFINHEQEKQYIMLSRVGIMDGVFLEFMLIFPHIGVNKSPPSSVLTLNQAYVREPMMAGIYCNSSDVKEMIEIFNSFCEKLKISNIGEFKADATIIDRPAGAEFYRYKKGE